MKVKGLVKQWRYPEASERDLSRSLQDAMKKLVSAMRQKTGGMKFDASDEEINDAQDDLESLIEELITAIVAILPMLALNIYRFNTRQWLIIAKSVGGKDNPAVQALDLLGATAGEEWYLAQRKAWQSLAQESVRKLFVNVVSDWSTKVRSANLAGKSGDQINEILNQRYKVYSTRCQNRAAGIVGTWNSVLMRQRIKDAGVRYYIWRGVMDLREREKHVNWEGKKIEFNSDHVFPGEEYNCRCWAVPHFDNVGAYNDWRGRVNL